MLCSFLLLPLFCFNTTATTEIYTLSLHDALPICHVRNLGTSGGSVSKPSSERGAGVISRDRKSTRLNSSHLGISYAVFCLKKKKKQICEPKRVLMREPTHTKAPT